MEGVVFFAVIGGFVSSVAAYCATRGWWTQAKTRRHLRRLLKTSPRLPLEKIQQGPCLARGAMVANETVEAPLSGTPVIGYRLRVQQYSDVEYGYQRWKDLLDTSEVGDFLLADGTGRAHVKAGSGAVWLLLLDQSQIRTAKVSPAHLPGLLAERGITLEERPLSDGQVYFTEYQLLPGEEACVVGLASRELDRTEESQNYREPPTRLLVEPPASAPMLVANVPPKECVVHMDRAVRVRGRN